MSYPPSRYNGDAGEVSATVRRASSDPDLEYANGTSARFLATGASTDGLFGLFRFDMSESKGGPGPHFHRTMAESFFVLDGSIQFYDGTGWVDAAPGDFVHVPPGGIHGFRNESGAPASMLIHFAPGGPREAYFAGTARWSKGGRPSEADAEAFYREHDNIFL
jgi:mannose-6-phosphate isomerase-like protein (cupin superfamily)